MDHLVVRLSLNEVIIRILKYQPCVRVHLGGKMIISFNYSLICCNRVHSKRTVVRSVHAHTTATPPSERQPLWRRH